MDYYETEHVTYSDCKKVLRRLHDKNILTDEEYRHINDKLGDWFYRELDFRRRHMKPEFVREEFVL